MMRKLLKLPTVEQAVQLMNEAEQRNPGGWVQHCYFVAQAAQAIAARHPSLDSGTAYVLGLLHDIGRREGVTDMRHIIDGYTYMSQLGFADAARICLTHSFPYQHANAGSGQWDCSPEEFQLVENYLAKVEYTDYDRLIQLGDALATAKGFCLIEKRLVDVALRRGINDCTVEKWRAFLNIQKDFEQVIGESIYSLLPGVVENTFGFERAG